MDEQTFDVQFEAANRRGLEAQVGEVRALSAHYERVTGVLVLGLRGGLTLLVPAALLQGVAGHAPELIERVEVTSGGAALRWEELDADFSVQSLAAGSFGSVSWMQHLEDAGILDAASVERRRLVETLRAPTAGEMGRKGGAARSARKSEAARVNGAKGGRPKKSTAIKA
ncbi:MAG TPA: DUF2442 domain-containing protein [Abditibacterium sp.]|jgi:hypothetical protein